MEMRTICQGMSLFAYFSQNVTRMNVKSLRAMEVKMKCGLVMRQIA